MIDPIYNDAKEYIDNRIDFYKLNAADKLSKFTAALMAGIIACALFLFFLLFAGAAAVYALNLVINEIYWSFLIVGGFFLIVGILVWKMKDKLIRFPVLNGIMQQIFNQANDETNK